MPLLEKIEKDLREAQKSKNETVVSTLRLLKNAIKNSEIRLQKKVDDSLINEIIAKEIKSRKESIEQYQKGGRPELAEKEAKEIEILRQYQPKQLSKEEIEKIVKQIIVKVKAVSAQDMGKVMAEVMPELKGKADGAQVSQIVKENLLK